MPATPVGEACGTADLEGVALAGGVVDGAADVGFEAGAVSSPKLKNTSAPSATSISKRDAERRPSESGRDIYSRAYGASRLTARKPTYA
jgi:hypothetical protein